MRLLPRRLKRAAGAAGEPDAPGAEGCEILRFPACSLATVLSVHRTRCPMFILTHLTLLSTPRSHYSIRAFIILRPPPLSPGAWRTRSGKSRKMTHFFKKQNFPNSFICCPEALGGCLRSWKHPLRWSTASWQTLDGLRAREEGRLIADDRV